MGIIKDQKQEINEIKVLLNNYETEQKQNNETLKDLQSRHQTEMANNKQLQFDIKCMKSQLERLSMFNNEFGSNSNQKQIITEEKKENNPKLKRNQTVTIHPDISSNDGNEVDLSLEFDRFYSNSLSSLIGDFIARSKLDNKEKYNEYHKKKERGHLMFDKNEVPKFLWNRNNRDAQQQELEDQLGFGYQELFYLYRENIRFSRNNMSIWKNPKISQMTIQTIQIIMIQKKEEKKEKKMHRG